MALESYALNFSPQLMMQAQAVSPTFLERFKLPAAQEMQRFASLYCTVKNNGDVTELTHSICAMFFTQLSEILMNDNNKPRHAAQNIVAGWSKLFMCNTYVRNDTLVTTLDILTHQIFYSENLRENWLAARSRHELFLNTLQ